MFGAVRGDVVRVRICILAVCAHVIMLKKLTYLCLCLLKKVILCSTTDMDRWTLD